MKIGGRENVLKLVSMAQGDLQKVLNIVNDNIVYETTDADLDLLGLELGAE